MPSHLKRNALCHQSVTVGIRWHMLVEAGCCRHRPHSWAPAAATIATAPPCSPSELTTRPGLARAEIPSEYGQRSLNGENTWLRWGPLNRQCPLLRVKRTWRRPSAMSAYDPKRTFCLHGRNSDKWRYSPLVRWKETDRIRGAASTTTGNIVTQEMAHDNSQWTRNWPIVTNGKLAIPAAIRDVNPAWMTAKIKWLSRRGMANIADHPRVTRSKDHARKSRVTFALVQPRYGRVAAWKFRTRVSYEIASVVAC